VAAVEVAEVSVVLAVFVLMARSIG